MKIVDFSEAHIGRAVQIAKMNYQEERGAVPALPPVDNLPDLMDFAQNNRGVAALDGGELCGFFCWYKPWDNYFGLCKGAWSPMHAHGAVKENRAEIYDRLYQAAAAKLVAEGVLSHSVTLYEHDAEAIARFLQNGFGPRCVDAVRQTTPIPIPPCGGITYRQAGTCDAHAIAEMNNSLVKHLQQTPIFLPCFQTFTADGIAKGIQDGQYQYFLALDGTRPVAYIRLQDDGENFAGDDKQMMNISGAYALPDVRGKGVTSGLLSWLMDWLRERDYSRCGVDFECFNYTARKFWLKHFTAYTNSVVRRMDERILDK